MTPAWQAQLEDLITQELRAIEDSDREGGIEAVEQLTVYLTSLANAAFALGQQQAREQLSFYDFQAMNLRRCRAVFFHEKDWTPNDWALAVAGEVGELCNLLKKIKRGDFLLGDQRQNVLRECADVFCYLDLLMSSLDADTGAEVLKKFDEVSDRYNYKRKEPA
jgi:NTP pyrophosphatase (non-canonical NTP hydrolase)